MRKLLMSKPVLIAGAMAARKKIAKARVRRKRKKMAGIVGGLTLAAGLSAAGYAAYKRWVIGGSEREHGPDGMQPDRQSAINLDAPVPAPNI